jgi:uncharacterized protein
MAEVFHRKFLLKGPTGRLEALLWTTSAPDPPLSAVVCHPHPLFGGTLHNKVVFQTAKTLQRRGVPVLRFNFRGAGMSEGGHDRGDGEADDVRAALDFLALEYPGRPILLAGFSFGAWVGLRVGCEDTRVAEVIGLGLPVNDSDLSYLLDCVMPKFFIHGSRDQFGAREKVEALFAELQEPKRLVFIEGADHFFTGKLTEMAGALDKWLDEQHPELREV